MKIVCMDARMLGCSGIGTYIRSLILHLQNAPFQLILITKPDTHLSFPFVKAFKCLPCKSPIYSLQEQIQLPRIIPKCDLFWSPHFNAPFLPIRAKNRLLTLHDAYHLAYFQSLKLAEKIYVKTILTKAVQQADHIVTPSQFSFRETCKYLNVNPSKISVIPSGINTLSDSTQENDQAILKIKQKYSLPDHFFLFVGNIKPHKNLRGALAGYQQLDKTTQDRCPFLIVGQSQGLINTDPFIMQLQKKKAFQEKVRFLGSIPDQDLFILYRLATALVFPSFYEGFGFPPLEAMSRGCPVIASKIPSLEETCADAACYILPSNPATITKAMNNLLTKENFRFSFIAKGKERIALFNWKKTANAYITLIKNLFGNMNLSR